MTKTIQQIMKKQDEEQADSITDEAYNILKDIYASRSITQTVAESLATKQTFKAIHNICAKRLLGRYVLSLSAGSGKTTFMIAWCSLIHRQGLNYSVSIASQKVDDCFKLRKQLLEQGVPEEEIGILYKDNNPDTRCHRETCPSTKTPEKHRFLLVTHARLQLDPKNKDYLQYNGEHRSIIFWDEAFRKAGGSHYSLIDIKQDLSGFLAICDDEEATDIRGKQRIFIKDYIKCILEIIEKHQETPEIVKTINEDLVLYEEHKCIEVSKVINKLKRINPQIVEMMSNLIDGQKHFLKGSKVYSYRKVISDDIQQMLILDASYKHCELSKLDKSVKPLNINIPRSYPNLTIRYAECCSGNGSTFGMLKNPKRRTDFIQRVTDKLNDVPENEAVLFLIYKDKNGKNFQEIIRRELQNQGFDLNQRIITDGRHRFKYCFLTWGNQNGTNEFQHCRHLCSVGIMDMGADNITAQAIALSDGVYLNDDEALSAAELNHHDYAQRLYQAIFRLAVRRHGENTPCTVTLFINRYAMRSIEQLRKALPNANFIKERAVFKDKETATDKALHIVRKYLDNLPNDIKMISTQMLYEGAKKKYGLTMTRGVKRRVTEGLKKMVKNELSNLWCYEGRSLVMVSYF